MTIRGTRLAIRLASETSQPTGQIDFQSSPDADAVVGHVFFLHGRDSSDWLVTVDATHRSISWWEILKNPLNVLSSGSWTFEGYLIGIEPDHERMHDGLFAVSRGELRVP